MVIGIDIGGTNIRVGLVDKGVILNTISAPCPSDKPEEEVMLTLINLIKQIITPKVKAIGVGVPSVVDIKQGIVYNVANIVSWKKVYLKNILEQAFAVPVFINNDSNCFALGETKYGTANKFTDVVGITLGTGLGAGVVINGKLYCGQNTSAGEVGSISTAFPYFKVAMTSVLKEFPYPNIIDNLKVIQSTTPNISILGAAALCDKL